MKIQISKYASQKLLKIVSLVFDTAELGAMNATVGSTAFVWVSDNEDVQITFERDLVPSRFLVVVGRAYLDSDPSTHAHACILSSSASSNQATLRLNAKRIKCTDIHLCKRQPISYSVECGVITIRRSDVLAVRAIPGLLSAEYVYQANRNSIQAALQTLQKFLNTTPSANLMITADRKIAIQIQTE